MLGPAIRPLLRMRHLRRASPLLSACSLPSNNIRLLRRNLSVQTIYPSFPASLLRYSPHQKSSLFDIKDLEKRGDDPLEDAVTVSTNGLVYPGVIDKSSRMTTIFGQGIGRMANYHK
jgi:hypothetical protein